MSDDNAKISVTLKGGAGYEAPWIVLRADTAADMVALMTDVTETGLTVAVRAIADSFRLVASGSPQQAAQAILGATPVPSTPPGTPEIPGPSQGFVPGPGAPAGNGVGNYPSNAPPQQPWTQPNQQNQQLPPGLSPQCPTCGGPTTLKQSAPGAQRAWKGYFCQNAPRDQKHEVTWVK